MKLAFVGIFGLFLSVFGLFFAQPDMDAKSANIDYITDEFMLVLDTHDNFDKWSRQAIVRLEPSFAALNVEVIDGEALMYELFADHSKAALIELRATLKKSFLSRFTREEVALLANFYRSAIGQDLISRVLMLNLPTLEKVDFFQKGDGQHLLQKIGHVVSDLDDFGERSYALIDNQFTANRLADIAEVDGILKFQSEAHQNEFIETLRQFE